MNEVKVYGVILLALMVAAYLSFHREDPDKAAKKEAVLLDIEPLQLDGLVFLTKTQTVAVSFKKDESNERYPWFEIQARTRKRAFAGNEKFKAALDKFAPFKALRSLGTNLTDMEMEETKLKNTKKKLSIKHRGKEKLFMVGGRTSGARDHYVQNPTTKEVYLVASKQLGDLEYPEGRFMQRKLRLTKIKEVDKVQIAAAGGHTRTFLHRNRHAGKEAFWSTEESPDEKDETISNYVDKLDKLTAIEYLKKPEEYDKATPVMEVTWFDEHGKSLGWMKLSREGEEKSAKYFSHSSATRVPVKVSRYTAEQIDRDLKLVLPQ